MSNHQHTFFNDGIRFKNDDRSMAGSGARVRRYFRIYRCNVCLDFKVEHLGDHGNSYEEVKFQATPLSDKEYEVIKKT